MRLFDLFETPLVESIRAYHGSDQDSPVFARSHTGNNSTIFGGYEVNRTGTFFSNNPEFSALYGKVAEYNLDIHHTLEDDQVPEHMFRFAQTIDAHGPERDLWISAMEVSRHGPAWESFDGELGERFVAYLIDQGYDSAQFYESHEGVDEPSGRDVEYESMTTVVFDPSSIHRLSNVTQDI